MDSLIMVMNKLQDVFSTVGSKQKVDLPQIIVVGSQSSGKSSVLESLVGKSFLPRGTGIVTRAPLVLHLIEPTECEIGNGDSMKSKDYAIFLHKPGLTKVPVGGQPQDIEQKIRELVLSFIKNPNSIILAVVTANTDPATSESLHIAKSVDPNGDRTIAVVTKIDIMDAGTDASELLSGEVIPVKLGIIGVINRSQKDINDQKTIEHSLKDENTFFDKFYPDIAQNHGTVVLGKQLESLLIEKIKETYPKLKAQLYEMNNKYEHEVKKYKEFTENYDRSLLDLITQTATSYKAGLDGRADLSYKNLNGGATIAKYFKTNFNKDINEIDPLQGLSPDIIINVINNASGTSMGVFMPTDAFDHLVKKQIQLLEAPSLACVTTVHDELMANIFKLDEDISYNLKKYPKLYEKINEILLESLAKYKLKTSEAVSKLIEYQKAYVNTDHVDFIDSILKSDEFYELFEKPAKINKLGKFEEQGFAELPNYYNSQEEMVSHKNEIKSCPKSITLKIRKTVEKITTCAFSGFPDSDKLILESRAGLLKLFIKCYFMVIKKIIQDTVPKTILCEMVNKIKDNFQKDLISKVYKSSNLNMAELLLESKDIEDERIKAIIRYDASTKALQLMREIEQICLKTES
ncbi:dynamin-1-like protein [Metopolophium dirhodum]|uniref:dynamin-1-like protein n=1 Tax=Metopolophium dirhodum TaxID=44670 RepID=UPI0029904902|nr:dynamin-1-like protein [Metopolophium dirhodum]